MRKMADKAFQTSDPETREIFSQIVPFWSFTNFDKPTAQYLLILLRLLQACLLTQRLVHPDEYWQGIEVAYSVVYGGV